MVHSIFPWIRMSIYLIHIQLFYHILYFPITTDLSSYNPFAVLLLGMIATLVAMAIMMGVVKLVRILPDISGYQQVPFEGI